MKNNYKKNSANGFYRFSEKLLCVFIFLFSISVFAKSDGEISEYLILQGGAIIYKDADDKITNENAICIQGDAIIYNSENKSVKQQISEKKPKKITFKKKVEIEKSSKKVKRKEIPETSKLWIRNSPSNQEHFATAIIENGNSIPSPSTNYSKPNSIQYTFVYNSLIFSEKLILYAYSFLSTLNYLFPQIFCRPPTC